MSQLLNHIYFLYFQVFWFLYPQIKNKSGQLVDSTLYKEVLSLTKDRDLTKIIYSMVKSKETSSIFERRIISHGQRSLRGELVWRYIDHARTDEASTQEVAKTMGLLPESDACYTDNKHKKNSGHFSRGV